MPKNMQTIVILIVIALALFVIFGFFGIGGFTLFPGSSTTAASPTQTLLTQIQQQGGVTSLQTVDITEGTGDPVAAGDSVEITYTGVLPDGTVFDSSDAHGGEPLPFTIGAGDVIPGMDQGVTGMKVGGRRIIAIPPALGYGTQAVGPIPANSSLIFDVTLVSRTAAGTPATPPATPPAAQ